jgi:hypothetical protein
LIAVLHCGAKFVARIVTLIAVQFPGTVQVGLGRFRSLLRRKNGCRDKYSSEGDSCKHQELPTMGGMRQQQFGRFIWRWGAAEAGCLGPAKIAVGFGAFPLTGYTSDRNRSAGSLP